MYPRELCRKEREKDVRRTKLFFLTYSPQVASVTLESWS